MIYVIQTSQYDEKQNHRDVIKVGYTNNWKKRKMTYEEYCHNFIILQIYDDGTLEDESKLKKYFKDSVVYKNEWIKCTEENLSFFKENDTIEKLRRSLEFICSYPYVKKKVKINKYLLQYVINTFHSDITDPIEKINKRNELEEELCHIPKRKHIEYISSKYTISKDTINNEILKIEEKYFCSEDEISDVLKEFNNLGKTRDKLKFLVKYTTETPGVTKQNINSFLAQIPDKYGDYYRLLGPDRIKANGYLEADLRKEWIKLHSEIKIEDGMISRIFGSFSKGERYSNKEIKETLKNIYSEFSHSKTAKASDLTDYFVVKDVVFQKDSKWVHGFEILGKR